MRYDFAPLEGITGYPFRAAHARCFPGVDRYYTPFIAANGTHSFKTREKKEIDPAHNAGIHVIPQVLTNDAGAFLWAAGEVAARGYAEVNLNLGCPSATVVTHGKGAGFLAEPERLDRFFEAVFEGLERGGDEGGVSASAASSCGAAGLGAADFVSASAAPVRIKVSVKTRVGVEREEEAGRLIEIFNRYPISEVIVHPRLRTDFYKGEPRMEIFEEFYENLRHPVVYNGDVRTAGDAAEIERRFPGLAGILIGRGMLMNPALVREIRAELPADGAEMKHEEFSAGGVEMKQAVLPVGGAELTRAELRRFHEEVLEAWLLDVPEWGNVIGKMKELWYYMGPLFADGERLLKKVRKARREADYRAAVEMLFSQCELLPAEKRTWRP